MVHVEMLEPCQAPASEHVLKAHHAPLKPEAPLRMTRSGAVVDGCPALAILGTSFFVASHAADDIPGLDSQWQSGSCKAGGVFCGSLGS